MRHWAPVTRMYKIALMTWRISRLRGRPPNLAAGIKSLIQSQWRSARSVGDVCVFIPQVYPTQSADRHPFQTASEIELGGDGAQGGAGIALGLGQDEGLGSFVGGKLRSPIQGLKLIIIQNLESFLVWPFRSLAH